MGIANSSMVKEMLASLITESTKNKGNGDDGKRQQQWMMGEDAFNAKAVHHQGIKELWEAKWKFPCMKGVYPFHDGCYEDFAKVFDYLIKNDINDGYSDDYTKAFFPVCDDLKSQAASHEASSQRHLLSPLYLRIACLYRIARFPYISSPLKRKAWELQKEVYMKAGSSWIEPMQEVNVPHTHVSSPVMLDIPIYLRAPVGATKEKAVPTILLIMGLDGHRPDNTQRTDEILKRGWACVIVEIPGTADCPADLSDPNSPDRLWDSIFEWMNEQGIFDMKRVVAWGLSCGGYYAVRIAHTHREKLRGAVAHGTGVHHCFDEEWLEKANMHEYPFALLPALSKKFGYDNPEEFKREAQKTFSLVETGIIEQESARLLLINGVNDGLMPIEDSMLLFNYGSPKEARFIPNSLHMGYPTANSYVYPWLESVMASQ
ncbi:hypothetical protein N7G274_005041 [Stereocaulon virgatum]|uniref:Alpha/beta-hydrolase n=1 Tax=Stereocaulon virgatum TaxID=373712 RepID=A0ABR4A9J3_9LECA